jgi:glutamate/tyrosine decarboxylase-like PLP-dependent enzyme
VILASEHAHYTHRRITQVLRLDFESVPCDRRGRMDVAALERRLARGGVGTVVATLGATATGAVDPLGEVLALRERYGFRVHADAAYGGYFVLADGLAPGTRRAFDHAHAVDSIVIDPHKHGLQPYGCGCVLFRDPAVGRFYKHDSPYTYFSSGELHLGEISLECSRPGAAAAALWATERLLPLERGGAFAAMLSAGRAAALDLYARLGADRRFVTALAPELDIVVWAMRAPSASQASVAARRVFAAAAERGLHLALADLPASLFDLEAAGMDPDRGPITCLRSVLMKPEHREWLDRIWGILDESVDAVSGA